VRHARAAALGVLADQVFGEFPLPRHPVAVFGTAMGALERALWRDDRSRGVAHLVAGAGLAWLAGRAVGSTTIATAVAVAGNGLGRAAREVAAPLRAGDLDEARARLPSLVGRDPAALDGAGIARAVVESVAENTVDAVVAPALWGAVSGAPGAFAYRGVNTLDSMVGYRSPRYARFGWASARADDVANWVPARLTAALVATVRPSAARLVYTVVRRDSPAHPSPNAGVAEAAFAAALGLRLGGTTVYAGGVEARPVLGDGRLPSPHDIDRAVQLSRDVTLALVSLLVAASGASRRSSGRGRARLLRS
jgi:adenosylcobinamide-phosphate synthase